MIYGMRVISIGIALCFFVVTAFTQDTPAAEIRYRRIEFYKQLTANSGIEGFLDDSLSYGHSNGWIETKADFLENLGSKLVYHSVSEDSLRITVHGNIAHARFVGDFNVSLNGKRNTYHLRVLEVWVKSGNLWKLFARQAIRMI